MGFWHLKPWKWDKGLIVERPLLEDNLSRDFRRYYGRLTPLQVVAIAILKWQSLWLAVTKQTYTLNISKWCHASFKTRIERYIRWQLQTKLTMQISIANFHQAKPGKNTNNCLKFHIVCCFWDSFIYQIYEIYIIVNLNRKNKHFDFVIVVIVVVICIFVYCFGIDRASGTSAF